MSKASRRRAKAARRRTTQSERHASRATEKPTFYTAPPVVEAIHPFDAAFDANMASIRRGVMPFEMGPVPIYDTDGVALSDEEIAFIAARGATVTMMDDGSSGEEGDLGPGPGYDIEHGRCGYNANPGALRRHFKIPSKLRPR